jgi:7-cyano-7-deazaguanine synthase
MCRFGAEVDPSCGFFEGLDMDKAVVLLSGGINSAVAASAFRQRCELFPLFVQYGQRAAGKEAAAFDALCHHFDARHVWKAELTHFRQVGGSSLIDPTREIEDACALTHGVASTFVPGLMPALLDIGMSFAARIGARYLVTGVSEAIGEPSPGSAVMYPDNRREFLSNYQYLIESALPAGTKLTLESPVADFDRPEIVKLGSRLEVPFDLTWSCYHGGDKACGTCFGCASRAVGFLDSEIADPQVVSRV